MDQENGIKALIALLAKAPSEGLLSELFDLLFTLEEKVMINQRCLIIQALRKGDLSQREISQQLHASIAQITRGSNALKTISPELSRLLHESHI